MTFIGNINKLRILLTPKDKRRLLGIAFLMALAAWGETAGIGLLVGAIALFLNPGVFETNRYLSDCLYWSNLSQDNFLILAFSLIVLLLVSKNFFALWVIHLQSRFVYQKQSALSLRLFTNYMKADYRYSMAHPLPERYNNIFRMREICTGVLLPLMQFWADTLAIVLLGLLMTYFMPWITLGSLTIMLLATWLIVKIPHAKNLQIGRTGQKAQENASKMMHAGLSGNKTIKIQHKEDFFIRKYHFYIQQVAQSGTKLYTLGQIPRLMFESIILLLVSVIFLLMQQMGNPTDKIILTFSMIAAVMSRVLPALSRCNYNLTQMRQHQYLFDTLFSDMTDIPREKLGDSATAMSLRHTLAVQSLEFSYGNGRKIFENLNFELPAKQNLGIVGKTGSGKTTLMDLLVGLLRPDAGKISADGTDIFENLASWRQLIGYVPQDVFICEGTLRENIALGVPADEIDNMKIQAVLQTAQLQDFVRELPLGIHSRICDAGANLSGGQRQRIGIARALYFDPQLLLLDEATSALDAATEEAFVQALNNLHGKLTMIIIAHRLSTLNQCDIIVDLTRKAIDETTDST